MLEDYKIETLDSDTEGILWLKFISKHKGWDFCCCVCYVPPTDSTRAVDLNEFYDTLMCQVHLYCRDMFFFICGDFNARCGDLEDFIPGVDSIPERNVVDYYVNKEGESLCEFLDTNCCILNGRNFIVNDYTFVGPQGMSVVDYCIIPYEALDHVNNFKVSLEKDLFTSAKLLGCIDPSVSHPDHSLLTWDISMETVRRANVRSSKDSTSYVKFDRTYPSDFLSSRNDELNTYINKIESDISTQSGLDNIYKELVALIKDELLHKVHHKEIKINSGTDNKRRRTKKP